MRINNNLNAMTALNQATKNTALAGTSMNKLSSGERINKAGDDAAGMAISEKMRAQIRGLDQASKNTQDGISVVQTAEGAMEEVGNIAQRMRELSVQSANETNTTEDRSKIAEELSQLHDEINRIADSTQFNGKNLLNGSKKIGTQTETVLTTSNADKFEINASDLAELGLGDGGSIKVQTADDSGKTKMTLTVLDKTGGTTSTYEVTGLEKGTAAGSIKTPGKLLLTNTADPSKTIEIDVKNAEAIASTSADLISGADVTSEIKGTNIALQVGANTTNSQALNVNVQNVSTQALGLGSTKADIDAMKDSNTVTATNAAKTMINKLDKALEVVNTSRANLGAMQNRLETASSNLTTSSENLTAAESRIRDVDVAKEMMNLSKLNLLNQASQAMMSQAKSQPEGVMQLLR